MWSLCFYGGLSLGYAEGFEDAMELCLVELKKANSLEDAEIQCQKVLELVKTRKMDRIKGMLAIL